MRIGILSDTHGTLRGEVTRALQGVDHIIHAGDIDNQTILHRLEQIAPVTAVRGNADKGWAEHLPQKVLLEFLGNRIYVIHNKAKIDDCIEEISIIIYGHSHKYSLEVKKGQTWFNPGCCGKRKQGQEISFAILTLNAPGDFVFEKIVIENGDSATQLPGNIDQIIARAMAMTDRG